MSIVLNTVILAATIAGAEAELKGEIDVGGRLSDDANSDSRYFGALTYPWM